MLEFEKKRVKLSGDFHSVFSGLWSRALRSASKVRPSTRNPLAFTNIREHTASHDELVFSGCWFEDMHLYPEDCWIDGGGNSSS